MRPLLPTTCLLLLLLLLLSLSPAGAQTPAQPLISAQAGSQSGSLPLPDVLATVKGAPRFKIETRLQLLRAKLKPADVVCTGRRFSNTWTLLGGARFAPYECTIGLKTLFITSRQTYYDASGRRLAPSDPDLMSKAAKLYETNFKWRWK